MAEFTGYAIDDEDHEFIRDTALVFNLFALTYFEPPKKYDPTDWWIIENQGVVGRCAGMAASSVGELAHQIQTGEIIQFNGHFSYIEAQKNSRGLYGRDAGSTMSGNLKAAKEKGFCPIDWNKDGRPDYPMPARYTTEIPPQAYVYALKYLIKHHMIIKSWDELIQFMFLGLGGVMVGARWGNWKPNAEGLLTRFVSGGGGHAWTIVGWDFTKDRFNEDVFIMVNSHGERWGVKGKAYIPVNFFNAMVRDNSTEVIGMSDLTTPAPRKIVWRNEWLLGQSS